MNWAEGICDDRREARRIMAVDRETAGVISCHHYSHKTITQSWRIDCNLIIIPLIDSNCLLESGNASPDVALVVRLNSIIHFLLKNENNIRSTKLEV